MKVGVQGREQLASLPPAQFHTIHTLRVTKASQGTSRFRGTPEMAEPEQYLRPRHRSSKHHSCINIKAFILHLYHLGASALLMQETHKTKTEGLCPVL